MSELTPETLAELGMEEAMTPRGELIGEHASAWKADLEISKGRARYHERLEARIKVLEKALQFYAEGNSDMDFTTGKYGVRPRDGLGVSGTWTVCQNPVKDGRGATGRDEEDNNG